MRTGIVFLATVLALCLTAHARRGAASGPDVTTSIRLPDGAVLYVRYGEPGGVKILNRFIGPDSLPTQPDTESARYVPAAPVVRPATDLLGELRALLREEIQRRGVAQLPTKTEPSPDTTLGLLDVEVGAGMPEPAERPTVETERVPPRLVDARTPGAPPVVVTVPPAVADAARTTVDFVETPVIPSPQVIRETILDEGLFSTNLVLFETTRAVLHPHSQQVLRVIGGVLKEFPEARVRVEGHADRRGSEEYNLALSQRRADAVREFLLDCCGFDPARITAVGYGESRPLTTGNSATDLALNRRVEFRILNPDALRSATPQPGE